MRRQGGVLTPFLQRTYDRLQRGTTMRFKLAAPLLLLSLLIAACGGDKASDSNNRTQREEPRQGQELVSAQALLHQSADALQDVESYSFDFRMGIGADGFSMNFDGTGQYQAPDQMYMHMDLGFLGETEMIMRGTDVYMKLQGPVDAHGPHRGERRQRRAVQAALREARHDRLRRAGAPGRRRA
jgi:outer membrane biogenesis lipoprotein LolB